MLPKILIAVSIALMATVVLCDFCSSGSVEIKGNHYCQPVSGILYTNVGSSGEYQDITGLLPDGTCSSVARSFAGPLAPLNEEVKTSIPTIPTHN